MEEKKERISAGSAVERSKDLSAGSVSTSDDNREIITIQSRVLDVLMKTFVALGEAKAKKLRWKYKITSAEVGRLASITPKQATDALYRLKEDCHLIWYTIKCCRYYQIRIPEYCFREIKYINPVTGFESDSDCL